MKYVIMIIEIKSVCCDSLPNSDGMFGVLMLPFKGLWQSTVLNTGFCWTLGYAGKKLLSYHIEKEKL